ncbi:hypothetical protein PENANT_c024G08237 [Penicillium antarcticum]|uniref:Uncharacterized protein n=1 Tax=Penicillium antarcticum TaxID=416450 RepID=A0A1V6PY25_9EURO|nr:hypothetical protein PENANT_c024G08237 [Penicillium antarcticum]
MQYAPQYQMRYASPPPPEQPPAQSAVHTRFCILRPEGHWSPLIPLDELPSWLQICNWTPDMHMSLYPVSMSFIPREGEYDVTCNHCLLGVDPQHKSVSERGPSSASSRAARVKNFPVQCYSPPKMQPEPRTMATEFGLTYGILGQPPFHSMLQSPLVGMCLVDMHAQEEELAVVSDGIPPRMGAENSVPSGSSDQTSAGVGLSPALHAGPDNSGDPSLSAGSSRNVPQKPRPDILKRHSRPTSGHDDQWIGTPRRVLSLRGDGPASAHSAAAMAAALAKHMQRRRSRRISRTSSLHRRTTTGAGTVVSGVQTTDAYTPKPRISKVPSMRVKVKSKARHKVRMHRQVAEDQRAPISLAISPKPLSVVEVPKPKPEQPNAATKRRDRRERLMRRRNHTDRGSRYWHMMKIPNWQTGVLKC